MSDHAEGIRVCAPPRSWVLSDGTTIQHGSRVQHTPTGEPGTVDHFAGPGWAHVLLDSGVEVFVDSRELTTVDRSQWCGSALVEEYHRTHANDDEP